jgi:hypothetical protein
LTPSSAQLSRRLGKSRDVPSAKTTTTSPFVERVAMDEIIPAGESSDEISIERCRELLGDEAENLCDDEIDRIRRCANTVARVVIEMFLDEKRPTIH